MCFLVYELHHLSCFICELVNLLDTLYVWLNLQTYGFFFFSYFWKNCGGALVKFMFNVFIGVSKPRHDGVLRPDILWEPNVEVDNFYHCPSQWFL